MFSWRMACSILEGRGAVRVVFSAPTTREIIQKRPVHHLKNPMTPGQCPNSAWYFYVPFSFLWAPRPPELQQWKNLLWCTMENVEDFSWNFLRPYFPGNWRTKICETFRQNFAAFFADLFEKIRKNFANLRKMSPKFRHIFRRSLRKISQELRSGGLRAQLSWLFWKSTSKHRLKLI